MKLGRSLSNEADEATAPTQEGHLLAIDTPLGKDVMLLTALDGTEKVSRGFVYTIEMLTLASDAEVRTLLGQPVTMWLRNDIETERRPLHGHIRHLSRLTVDLRGYFRWRAEVVPWLWFLTRSVDCRIYQNLTIPEILRNVFDEHGLSRYEFRLTSQYPKLIFCVQYRESAFDFVSRLMEHVGIFYWFEHHEDRHVLVLADRSQMAPFTQPQQAVLSVRPDLGEIQELEHRYSFHTGNWALNDFDFEVPTKNLRTREPTRTDIEPMKRFETYDYPGTYIARDHGTDLSRLRMEEEEARHHQILGSGSCVGFDAGKRFKLAPDGTIGGESAATYFLTEIHHIAHEPGYFANTGAPANYSNRFVAVPAETPYRPARVTPKPMIHGLQTATVVGPAGENIHTDKYGRVRLLFHWDRRGKRDEHASCWIRVSQHAAGSYWGSLAIPHVGQEMVVSFLEGDPDRPLIIGRVHNGNNMAPLDLPADKNKAILRDHGDNKIIMHGKAGGEFISLVSPRAINLVAMGSSAKPLSADLAGFDPYRSGDGLDELKKVLQEQDKTGHAPDQDPRADVNVVAEKKSNSLSIGDTNTWVGGDSNTWVKGDQYNLVLKGSYTDIRGFQDSIVHTGARSRVYGGLTNIITPWQHDFYPIHFEETPVMHHEVAGTHLEAAIMHAEEKVFHFESHTGVHAENMKGIHYERSTGTHIEYHTGAHIDKSPTSAFSETYLSSDTTSLGPYKVSAVGQCKISTRGQFEINTTGDSSIKSLFTEINSDITTTVKGAFVNVEASSMVEVKGAIIKIG